MDSKKNVGRRVEPWGTPAWTENSCEVFPSRTSWSCLLLRKKEARPNIGPEIPQDLSFVKKTSMSNPVESPGYMKCHSLSSPRPVKSHSNSIRYQCQRSAVDREDLKWCWESEKRPHFSRWSTILLFTSSEFLEKFSGNNLLYQMQKTTPLGRWIGDV